MLLDRDTIIRELYKDRARPLSGPWVPTAPAYDPSIAPWPFDPAAARALLAAAGVPAPRVTILIPAESRVLEKVTSIWQDDAKRAGVTITIEAAPWAELLRRARAGDFDGVVYSWTTAPEQDFFQHFHTAQSENLSAISDPELDRLLETIQITNQRPPRLALEHQLHRRLHDLQPLTFISSELRSAAFARRLPPPFVTGRIRSLTH
jgi:peptide/nickel transport system substrate-binding protein